MAWETLVLELPKTYPYMQQIELNKYPDWELVSVVGNFAYLKKRKIDIEVALPQYVDVAQFQAMIRKAIGEELGLDQK